METQNEYALVREKIYTCKLEQTFGILPVWEKTTVDLPKETRVRPDGLALTSRSTQSTLVRRALKRKELVQGSASKYVCPPLATKYWDIKYWAFLPTPAIGYSSHISLTTDWAHAMRMKLQDDKVSLAETLGEWRESAKYLIDGYNIMAKAGNVAREALRLRRDRRALARWFKSLFERDPRDRFELMDVVHMDLAIKFGISPNIALIQDVVEQLNAIQLVKRRLQVTVKDHDQYTETSSVTQGRLIVNASRSVRAIAYVTYDIQKNGFTAGNIAEALWAGTPVTFVLDWFLDVGSYLSSFNAMNGVSSFTGVVVTRETWGSSDTRVPADTSTRQYQLVRAGGTTQKSIKRELISTLPWSSLPRPRVPFGKDTDLLKKLFTLTEILMSLRKKNYRNTTWTNIKLTS